MKPLFPGARPLILPPLQFAACAVATLSHPALPGVDVVPYVPHSLVFAQLAAAATVSKIDSTVMVDLPCQMNCHPGLLNLPMELLPLISIVILPGKPGSPQRAVPISPASPPVAAALLARQRALVLRCIEPDMVIPASLAFCPAIDLPEDYRVYHNGLQRHFARSWSLLESAFTQANAEVRLLASLRAASALRSVRAMPRRRRLLIIDWQLFWLMSQLAEGAIADPSTQIIAFAARPPEFPATLYLPHPTECWCSGLVEYPALVAEFYENQLRDPNRLRANAPDSNVLRLPLRRRWQAGVPTSETRRSIPQFDQRASLDRLVVQTLISPDSLGRSPSTRERKAFFEYLPRLMAVHGRAIPHVAEHMLFAARTCGGPWLAQRMREAILTYPTPPALPSSGQQMPSLNDLVSGSGKPLFGSASGAYWRDALMRNEDLLAADLEREGALCRILGTPQGGTTFTVLHDYVMHESAVNAMQRKARKSSRIQSTSHPLISSIRDGIDFKATMRSHLSDSRGHVFVRREWRQPNAGINRWTPVVFLLDSADQINRSTISPIIDANPAKHRQLMGGSAGHDPVDHVFTVMTCVRGRTLTHGGHITIDSISAIGFLVASSQMGPSRWSQAVARLRTPCRTDPDREPQWRSWNKLERLLGWALKYGAEQTVLVVAPNGLAINPSVAAYATSCHKKICVVPIESVPALMIERLRHLMLVSANLKSHPERDYILDVLHAMHAAR